MTNVQYHRINSSIRRTRNGGRLPTGIYTQLEFREFEEMFLAYMSHVGRATVVGNVARALERHGVPLRAIGIGWELKYREG